jgi:hypothetical protein
MPVLPDGHLFVQCNPADLRFSERVGTNLAPLIEITLTWRRMGKAEANGGGILSLAIHRKEYEYVILQSASYAFEQGAQDGWRLWSG